MGAPLRHACATLAPPVGAIVGMFLLAWALHACSEADARTKQFRSMNSRASTNIRPNDWSADGGDAGSAADGGDAQVSPLDDHNSTLACKWDFIGMHPDAGASTNPLTASAGGSTCNLAENATPNQTGQNSTTGLYYIGSTRLNQLEFNNTSGGWATASTWAGPALAGNNLFRVVTKTPAAFATQTIININATGATEQYRLFIDATTTRVQCQMDDGPGSNSAAIVTGLNVSTLYLIDCYFDSSTLKTTVCVNRTCVTAGTATGGTGFTPDTASIGSSSANTQIYQGHLLEVQYHNSVTWWNETLHGTECDLIATNGGTCAL